MAETEENRSKWIKIRLKPTEQKMLEIQFRETTSRCLSEYARALLLGKPVTVISRDKSMDNLLEELMLLRRELGAIGNNLNQAVKNINNTHGFPDTRIWMDLLKVITEKLEPSMSEIKDRINHYASLWSQKLKAEKA